MVFNTLLSYHILVPLRGEEDNNLTGYGAIPVYPLDKAAVSREALTLDRLLNSESPFCIAIPGNLKEIGDPLANILISALGHTRYSTRMNKRLVFICPSGSGNLRGHDHLMGILAEFLQNLGFKNIDLIDLSAQRDDTGTPIFFYREDADREQITARITAFLVGTGATANVLIDSKLPVDTVIDALNRHIRTILSEKEISLIEKNIAASELVAARQEELEQLKVISQSQRDYLDFLLNKYTSDDPAVELGYIDEIRKFYHYEYEILPLWYKQFGHMIKVLMGKRTFRSLFNENVKKYKD